MQVEITLPYTREVVARGQTVNKYLTQKRRGIGQMFLMNEEP